MATSNWNGLQIDTEGVRTIATRLQKSAQAVQAIVETYHKSTQAVSPEFNGAAKEAFEQVAPKVGKLLGNIPAEQGDIAKNLLEIVAAIESADKSMASADATI